MSDIYELATWQWLPRPRPEVFDFFADARNLERITPAFLNFHVLTPSPIDMRAGAVIDYRLRLRGLPLRWRSEITIWDPPRRFADAQRRGPYQQWDHTHAFEDEDGGTMVHDRVLYRLIGPDVVTRIIDRVLVAPDTKRIFEFRHHALEECLDVTGQGRSGPVSVVRRDM
jgi:ligand-binding SRPBCC domain-containing protein